MYNKEKLNQIISEKSVIQRVEQIAHEISRSFEGEIPILVSVLNGSFIFTSDLVRAMKIDCEIDFIKVSTYFGDESKGRVDFQKDISIEITNRHVILVDDIIDCGGTIGNAAEALIKKGAKDVHVFVTHAVLSGDAVNKIKKSKIKKLIITDTIDNSRRIKNVAKIQVLSIAPLMAEAIKRISNSTSVSDLFN